MGGGNGVRLQIGVELEKRVLAKKGRREDIVLVYKESPDLFDGFADQIIERAVALRAERDTLVRVDRALRPRYPEWMKDVLHPELELTGPTEYDLATVKLWLHDDQKDGKWMKGELLYEYLKRNDILKTCLSLRDGEEIQKKGIAHFRKFFGGKAIFLWKSVVRDRDGDLRVSCLCEIGGQVVLRWRWLEGDWDGVNPAARLASN